MTIVIGCDNAAVSLKNELIAYLEKQGVTVENLGCDSTDDPTNYPTVAKRVCEGFIKIIDGLIKTETDRAAIVTHGGVMMALLTNFGLPQLPMHEWITPNGCGYTLRITPSLWMRGHKLEVVYEFPYEKNDEDGEEE